MEIKRVYNFDGVGEKDMYLLHHEEIESFGLKYPRDQKDPLLHDLRPELPDPSEMLEDVA